MKPGHYELWIIDLNDLNHTYQKKKPQENLGSFGTSLAELEHILELLFWEKKHNFIGYLQEDDRLSTHKTKKG